MTNYEQKQQNRKQKYSKNKILGIVLVCLSILMLFFTISGLPAFIQDFFLGVFGVVCYPIFAFMLLFGIAFLTGRKFVMSKKYLVYLTCAFLCVMAILHIIFTKNLDNSDYGAYLADCYNTTWTPGGLLLGLFTFPVTSLLNHVAGYVLYAIILVVLIALIIDYLYAYKQYSKLTDLPKAEPEEITPQIEKQETPTIFKTIVEQTPTTPQEFEEEVFDEEPEKQTSPAVDLSPREIARLRLNLTKAKKEESQAQDEEQPKDNGAFLGRGVNNNRPPKISSDGKKDDGKASLRDFLNKTYGIETKPTEEKIINNSNFADAFTKEPIAAIEPTIQQEKNVEPISPIVKDDFVPNKYKREELKSAAFDRLFEPKQQKIEELQPEPIIEEVDEDEESTYVDLDEETTPKAKGLSPLNPKSLQPLNLNDNIEVVTSIPDDEDDDIDNDTSSAFVEPEPITPDFVGLDPAAAIAQENTIKDSLQKEITLNAPKVDNGIDVKYVQQFIKGTEKQTEKQKTIRRYTKPSTYVRPPINLLTVESVDPAAHSEEENERARDLEQVLAHFKIEAKVVAIRRGAAVTRFELQIPLGTPVNKIGQHSNDIAMALRSKSDVRIEMPIRGKKAVGVEVPNDTIDTVGLKDIIQSPSFTNSTSPLTFGLGKDVDGKVFTCNLQKMPHLLVAGTTGSGKSVCLNAMITSLLYKSSPEDVKFILIDPKKVEFSSYNYLPHMLVPTAITEPKKALRAFDWLIQEMENRFLIFQEDAVKNIEEYNDSDKVHRGEVSKLPYIVLIVDEFADLQNSVAKKTDLEDRIKKLAAKSRAAGIHLVIATQRPSVDVITGVIKNNLPSKIAFAVGSNQDSRTILSMGGAEKLLGKGDMLYSPNNAEPTRVQCAYIDTKEVNAICDFIRDNNTADYDESIEDSLNQEEEVSSNNAVADGSSAGVWDPLMKEAVRFVIEIQKASASIIQRKFAIGFNKAARIADQMYEAKFIGPSLGGSKPRAVYITKEQFTEIFGEEY